MLTITLSRIFTELLLHISNKTDSLKTECKLSVLFYIPLLEFQNKHKRNKQIKNKFVFYFRI